MFVVCIVEFIRPIRLPLSSVAEEDELWGSDGFPADSFTGTVDASSSLFGREVTLDARAFKAARSFAPRPSPRTGGVLRSLKESCAVP